MRVILAGLVVISALSGRSEACSCISEPVVTNDQLVPINVRIPILGVLETNSFELRDANGALIPTTTEAVPGGLFLVPLAPLQPNSTYGVSPVVSRLSGQAFRTGEGPDDVAPVAAPILGTFTRAVIDGSSTCGGPGESFSVNVSETIGEPSVHEVFVGATTDTIDTRAPAFFLKARPMLFLSEVSICEPKFPTSARADLAIAIRTRDLAGNVSPLSNAVQLKTAGCSSTGAPGLLFLAGLLTQNRAKSRRKRAVP
jgi:hypothetical protein